MPAQAYSTAVLEAWSISAFPGYTYPDLDAMLTVGSAFYSLFFLCSYPMFWMMQPADSLWSSCVQGLACAMLVMMLGDGWRIGLGPISHLINDTGVGHPVTDAIVELHV